MKMTKNRLNWRKLLCVAKRPEDNDVRNRLAEAKKSWKRNKAAAKKTHAYQYHQNFSEEAGLFLRTRTGYDGGEMVMAIK